MAMQPYESLLFSHPIGERWKDVKLKMEETNPATALHIGSVDVVETPEAYYVVADTPGMTKEDVVVEVKQGCIVFSGKRKPKYQTDTDAIRYYRLDRREIGFSRALKLPNTVHLPSIQAHCENGILTITLPKAELIEPPHFRVEVTGPD